MSKMSGCAAAGWARAASGAGNRWAAVVAAVRRRGREFRVQSLFELTNSKPTKLAL